MNKLTVTASGDTEVVFARRFEAPPARVFEAYTTPCLVQRWLLGPDGWTMPECEIELRPGGAYRYLWRNEADGREMGMGGIHAVVEPPRRLVVSERFDQPWYPGEASVDARFEPEGAGTAFTATIRYPTREARDGVLASGMEGGVAASYDRLEALLAETVAAA